MSNDQLIGGGISVFDALNGHVYGNSSSPTTTLILAHGFGTDQTIWHYLIPTLACFFKVVVFDLAFSPAVRPGFYDPVKYSNYTGYANDLISVIDELNVRRAVYLGHSMSAMVGCLASIQRPLAFKRLVLLGGSPRYLNAKLYNGGFNRDDINVIFDQIRRNYSHWVHSFAPLAVRANNKDAISYFEHSLLKMDPKIALSAAKAVFQSDLRWILPHVSVPLVTIIQSRVDVVVPEFVARYISKKLGSGSGSHSLVSHLVILPTEGHFPQLTAYGHLLSIIIDTNYNSSSSTFVNQLNLHKNDPSLIN